MFNVRQLLVASAAGLLVSVAAIAADANVAGTWTVSTESPQGARESTLTLTQTGTALTGTIKGARGETPITGSVAGNAVKLTQTLSMGGQEIKIEYAATVDGAAMTGTATNPRGEAKFTAKKAP